MCLAKAFVVRNSEEELLAEEVTSLKVENGRLLVTTLFGEKKEIDGRIREIDFRSSRILMEETAGVA